MNMFFIAVFMFAFGSVFGWGLEVVYRKIVSKSKRWINPGFLIGPYLPLYGFGLLILYLLAGVEKYVPVSNVILKNVLLFLCMGTAMTVIEYIAGIIFVKHMKIKLWDYSHLRGNIQGIICPLYSFFWAALGMLYYHLLHFRFEAIIPDVFSNVSTYFILGMFYGIFIIDLVYSMQIVKKVKQFAEEKQIIIRLEELKADIIRHSEEHRKKAKFFRILTYENSAVKQLKQYHKKMENMRKDLSLKLKMRNSVGDIVHKVNYKKIFDAEIKKIEESGEKPSLLLHACCAPCSSAVLEKISEVFDITLFFYNPNISPEGEFVFRLNELEHLVKEMGIEKTAIIAPDYDNSEFEEIAEGLENLPEGGERCRKCYRLRLERSVSYAAENGFDYVTTTLSISPHKNAQWLNSIGIELGEKYDVKYLCSDFKKEEGYKRSCELSKMYNLYRQSYCGCKYSKESAECGVNVKNLI